MFEIRVILIEKTESLLGIMFDQGERELSNGKWIPFTRLRFGIVFLTLELAWYQKRSTQ